MFQLGVDFNRTLLSGVSLGWYTFQLDTIKENRYNNSKKMREKKEIHRKVVKKIQFNVNESHPKRLF